MRRPDLLSLMLGLVTSAVFLPVAWNDFVNYDDPDYVTANAHVQSGLTLKNAAWAFRTGHASNWHPLTWLSHMLDYQIFGPQPAGHHLVSAAFHVANTLLLFLLLTRITHAIWRSALVAALFALHPLHVESVAWISERKDVLSAFFWMLTIMAYAGYVSRLETRQTDFTLQKVKPIRSLPAYFFYALSLALFVMGLMSKPMMVTLPFVLLLLDYWPLERVRISNSVRRLPALLLEKVPFLILSIVSSCVTFLVQRKGGAVSTSISIGARIANALVAYARYLGKMLWPEKLSVLYPHPGSWPSWQVAGAGGLFLFLCVAAVLLARRRPYVAIGWFWFIGTLVPMIGLVQVGVQSMADRYTYVPLIGLFIMLVWGIGDLVTAKIARQRSAKVASPNVAGEPAPISNADSFLRLGFKFVSLWVALALMVCVVLTSRQLQYWRNSLTLFSHAVQVTKGNYLAYNNLGFYLSRLGRPQEAMENYAKALEINPSYEDALNNMGYALAGQKKPLQAIPYYQAALRVRPNHNEVHNNLGNALADLGEVDEAIAQYRIVLAQQPDHVDAHNNLGIALAMKGQLDEGIRHFQEAIRHKPNDAGAHSNLGNALAAQHKFKEAIKEYEECLRIKPDDAQAHNNLGNVLAEQGLLNESIAHYQQALHLSPENPEAHFNLGMALARLGRRPEAASHFTEALRLKPDYEQAKRQLEAITAEDRK